MESISPDLFKNLDKEDYTKIKKYVLDDGKDVKGVKEDLSEIIKSKTIFKL